MEEKIFYPQNALTFNLQLFAETALNNGTYNLKINDFIVTCDFTGIEGIDSMTTSTSLVTTGKNNTVTVGGNTFKVSATQNGSIKFNGSSSAITSFDITDVSVTYLDTNYSGTGKIKVNDDAINLSGKISVEKNLKNKTYTFDKTQTSSFNFKFTSDNSTTINGVTYNSSNTSVIKIDDGMVKLNSGTLTIGNGNENLSNNNFSVDSQAIATFKPDSNGVTIDDVIYKPTSQNAGIKVYNGDVTVDGKFKVKIATGKSVKLNGVKYEAKTNPVIFTYDYDKNEITDVSGALDISSNGTLKVGGVTFDGAGDLKFSDSSVALSGDFSVGAEGETLSNTTFKTSSGESTFNVSNGDSVKLNDATFTAGESGLKLDYNSSDDNSVTISGNATVKGTGHFYVDEDVTVTINNVEFKATAKNAELTFSSTDAVEISGTFEIGNGTQKIDNLTVTTDQWAEGSSFNLGTNGKVNIDGVTYAGNGKIEIESTDKITLSGGSINVSAENATALKDKNFSVDKGVEANFNLSNLAGDSSVNINGESYSATDGDNVGVSSSGETTITYDETNTGTKTISAGKTVTVGNVTYKTSANSSAKIDGNTIEITAGTVEIDATDLTDYTFKLATNSTAQINSINFTKTETGTGNDIKFTGADSVTLNSNFTIGNGAQFLDGLKVTLANGANAIFNLSSLGRAADGEQTIEGDSIVVDGVTYTGIGGKVNVSDSTVTLSQANIAITGTVPSGYTFTLTGGYTYTFGATTINATSATGTVAVSGISGELSSSTSLSSVTINGTEINCSGGDTIQQYNGVWATSEPTYSSYILKNGQLYGVNENGSDTVTAVSGININGSTVTLTGDKTLKVENSSATVISKGKTYTLSNSSGTFNGGDADGIISVDNGTITATATSGSIGVELADNAALKVGNYTYADSEAGSTSATIDVNASTGGVTVSNGTIKKSISSGTFTYDGATYTVGTAAEFKVGDGALDGVSLIGGNGTRNIDANGTYVAGGKTYTALNSSTLTAIGDTSGGYVTFNGTFTLSEDTDSFIQGSHTYTTSKVTYSLIDDGTIKIDSLTKNLYAAEGTRLFANGDSAKKTYNLDEYTVTAGTYTIAISNGNTASAAETLTGGTATYGVASDCTFHYKFGNANTEYTATSETNFTISFNNNDVTINSATGGGTRTASSNEKITYNNDTYTLNNAATIQLTLDNTPAENFYNGSATRTTNSTFTVSGNDNTYTASDTAILTLTKESGGSENVALTSGNGTRSATGDFTYSVNSTNQTYNSSNIVYVLETNQTDEKLYSAKGTRTVNNGTYTSAANNTYTLTAGTYTIDISNGNESATESLTGAVGSSQLTSGNEFYLNNNTYSALTSATLGVTVNGASVTESLTAGSGTRDGGDAGDTFTYNTKNYTVSEGDLVYVLESSKNEKIYAAKGTRSIDSNEQYTSAANNSYTLTAGTYTIDISNGNESATESLTGAVGSQSLSNGNEFYLNNNTYSALTSATLGVTVNGASVTESLTAGKGTRTGSAGTFTYNLNNTDKTYNSQGNITYVLASGENEKIYGVKGTRAFGAGDSAKKTYNLDEYTVTAGTYSFSLTNGTDGSESLSGGNATYSTSVGTFHFGNNEYTATAASSFGISINGDTTSLTSANGEGTRTAAGETTTSTYDSYTYTLANGATKKINITGPTASTEDFYNGSATRTTNSTFTVSGNDNTYTASGGTVTLTLTKTNGDSETVSLTTGSGTRTAAATNGKFTYNSNEYTTTNNLTYILTQGQTADSIHSAQGTRAYSGNVDYKEDSYTTAGTYDFELTNGTSGETLTAAGTYTTSGGTFHFGNNEYTATAASSFGISINGDTTSLTSANGEGTRTAAGETTTSTYDSYTYTLANDATKKINITGLTASTEDFYNGSATRTTNSTFTVSGNDNTYTASGGTVTLTLTKTNGDSETVVLTGAGTRSDNLSTFTYSDNGKVYNKTSTNIVYRIEGAEDEKVYTAKGERSAAGDTTTGDWGNTYTLAEGSIYSIDITAGAGTDTIKTGVATKNYSNGQTFKYDTSKTEYTATTYGVTLNLSVTNDTPTESFESGSAKNNSGYIIKGGSKADIGDVTYLAAGTGIVTVTAGGDNKITALDGGNITGTFDSGESATIGGIEYSAANGGTLEVSAVDNVKSTSGEFTAQGDFATARTIDSKSLNITGDTDVKATFSGSGATKLESLNSGAVVVNVAGATTAYAVENGTYKFGQQTFVVSGDNDGKVTFTLDNGIVTKISALNRTPNAYATVNVTETNGTTNGTTYSLKVTRDDDEFNRLNGTWSDHGLVTYVVTYDNGSFTVQGVDNASQTFTVDTSEYTAADQTLTLNNSFDANTPIVVMNNSDNAITVGKVTGIENTNGNAIQITNKASENFTLGSFDATTHIFTAGKLADGKTTVSTENFDVDDNGKFKVESDGTIVVAKKDDESNAIIEITAPTDAKVALASTGSFHFNNDTLVTVTKNDVGNKINFEFNNDGSVKSFSTTGSCKVKYSKVTNWGSSSDLAYDLAYSADVAPTFISVIVCGTQVIISGDDDGEVDFEATIGTLSGITNVSKDATIILSTGAPSTVKITDADEFPENTPSVAVTAGTKIRYNAVANKWVCGYAGAIDNASYTVRIGEDNKIYLYNSTTQTTNVADYIAAVDSLTPKNPLTGADEDGGVLPEYPTGGITVTADKVSSVILAPSRTYKINSTTIGVSQETTLNLTWSSGTLSSVSATLNNGESITYDNMTFTADGGNTTLTLPSTGNITLDSGKVKFGDVTIEAGTGTITITSDSNFTLGSGITSIKLSPASAKTYTINTNYIIGVSQETTLTLSSNSVSATLNNGESITYSGMTFTADGGNTTLTLGSGNITLDGNTKVTGAYAGKTFSVTASKTISFDDKVVKNLTSITLNANGDVTNISGDSQYTVDATAKTFTGISNGAQINTDSVKSAVIVTDSDGTFNIGGNNFVIAGDSVVTLKTDPNGKVTEIDGLDAAGSLSGDLSGVTKINTKDFSTNDTDIGVVGGSGKISKIYNLSSGQEVASDGGASTISTDGYGTFNFSAQTYNISAGTVDFLSSTNKITGIKNLAAGTKITLNQEETNLQVGGNSITNSAAVTLAMGDDTVAGVENFTASISGLSEGATVNVKDSDVTINGVALQISDTDYTAYAKTDGYGTIKGVGAGSTITKSDENAIIVPDAAGTFTFGNSGNDVKFSAVPSLKVDSSGALKEISGIAGGQNAVFSYEQTGLKFDNDTITLNGAASDSLVTLVANDGGNISEVKGLTGEISGLSSSAFVKATDGKVTVNGNKFAVTGDTDYTLHAVANDGYDYVKGLNGGANVTAAKGGSSLVTSGDGTYTFNSHQFQIAGDSEVTMKVDSTGSSIEAIDGITQAQLLVYQAESGLIINGTTITVPANTSNAAVTLNVDGNGAITSLNSSAGTGEYSLPAGVSTEIKTNSNVKINGKDLQISASSGTAEYTVRATANGYDLVTGLSNNESLKTVESNVTLVTDSSGTFKSSANTINTNDEQITLRTGSGNKFTMVGGLDGGQNIELYQAETGFNVNGKLITVAGASTVTNQQVTLTMGDNNTISTVENLRGDINGLSAGASLNVKTSNGITINTKNLNIGDSDYTVRTTSTGYDLVTGLSNNANVSTVEKNVTLVTDANGTYTLNNKQFITGGDATVSFVMDDSSQLKHIADLKGTISGDFTSEIEVNSQAVEITGDTAVSLKSNGREIIFIDGLSTVSDSDTKVLQTGGAASIRTDSDGTFIFGSDSHKFKIDNDAQVNFKVDPDDANIVTAISSLTASNASLTVYQDEDFTINGRDIALENVADTGIILNLDGSSTIKGVDSLTGAIRGLSDNATVNVTTNNEVGINDAGLKITGDTAFTAYAKSGGYSKITGVGGSEVGIVKAKNTSIVTDAVGTYTFGESDSQHKINIAGDTTVTLVTDDDTNLSAIKGVDQENATITFYQNEDQLNINNQTLTVDGVSSTDTLGLKFKSNGYVQEVQNLKGNISGLSSFATVNIKTGSAIMINDKIVEIDESTDDFTVKAETTGYSKITGVDNGANIKQASNATIANTAAQNTDVVLKFGANSDKTYTFNDSLDGQVTLVTDDSSKVLKIEGLNGTLSTPEKYNTINGAAVYASSTNVSIVADGTTSDVNGISSIKGLTHENEVSVPGLTYVEVTNSAVASSQVDVTINGVEYNLIGDADSIVVRDKTITGLDATARLTISGAEGVYNVNGTALTIDAGHNIVIGESGGAHLYEEGDIDFAGYTPTEDIINTIFTGTTITSSEVPTVAENETEVQQTSTSIAITTSGKTVNMGSGQLVVVESGVTNAVVNTSGASDTVVSAGSVMVNLGGTAERLMPTSETMTVQSYNHTTGAGIQLTNSDVIAAVRDMTLGNSFNVNGGATVNMNYATGNENIVNFFNLQGEMQKVGYANSSNQTINVASKSDDFVLKGSGSFYLYGGSGDDTAFGGIGDYFNLGAGNNYIEIIDSIGSGQSTVELSAKSGSTTVKGFDMTHDKVKVHANTASAYFTGNSLVFTDGNASLEIQDVSPTVQDSSGISYVDATILNSDNSDTGLKLSIAMENAAIEVTDVSDTTAYVGENSGVDLSKFEESASINLQAGTGTLASDSVTFRGITSLKGGSGSHTLFGSAKDDNTIQAGKGKAEIYGGGASNDLMIGYTDTGKVGATTFYFANNDGNDTISNFQFYSTVPSADNTNADVIKMSSIYEGVTTSGDDVILSVYEYNEDEYEVISTSSLTLKDAVGERFSVKGSLKTFIAQVGTTSISYDTVTNKYYATGEKATLNVSSNITIPTSINLGKLKADDSLKGDVVIIDASSAGAKMSLQGSTSDNTIKASANGDILYGGGSANKHSSDLLIGGAGADTFCYAVGDGNDTIQGYGTDDIVYIDIKPGEINAKIDNNSTNSEIQFKNYPYTLKIEKKDSSGVVTFQLQDGSQYKGIDNLKNKTSIGNSGDLAYDYWEINGANELLDGDANFWDGNGISGDIATDSGERTYLTNEIFIGDMNPSVLAGEQVYNFNDKE